MCGLLALTLIQCAQDCGFGLDVFGKCRVDCFDARLGRQSSLSRGDPRIKIGHSSTLKGEY